MQQDTALGQGAIRYQHAKKILEEIQKLCVPVLGGPEHCRAVACEPDVPGETIARKGYRVGLMADVQGVNPPTPVELVERGPTQASDMDRKGPAGIFALPCDSSAEPGDDGRLLLLAQPEDGGGAAYVQANGTLPPGFAVNMRPKGIGLRQKAACKAHTARSLDQAKERKRETAAMRCPGDVPGSTTRPMTCCGSNAESGFGALSA